MAWLRGAARRPEAPETGQGERVYAIGDIHGRFDLLGALLRAIQEDSNRRLPNATRLVFLGDAIDRGPDSAAVLRALHRASSFEGVTVLRGNHEAALLDCARAEREAIRAWPAYGGDATLASFGIAPCGAEEAPLDFARRLIEGVGRPLLDWLRTCPTSTRSGDYFFCHAGVRPRVPLDRQSDEDLLWIREDFTASTAYHGAVIVHGHSECDAIELLPNRINLDTGAYRTGVLSAIGLEGAKQWTISTGSRRGDGDIRVGAQQKGAGGFPPAP